MYGQVVGYRISYGWMDGGQKTHLVVDDHGGQLEPLELVMLHGHTDHPARVAHEEGDGLGGGLLGRHDEVPLVLTVRVVHHHHQLALCTHHTEL